MTEGGRRNDGRAEAAGFHGNDEHMSIENLNMGVELTYEIVRRMVTLGRAPVRARGVPAQGGLERRRAFGARMGLGCSDGFLPAQE